MAGRLGNMIAVKTMAHKLARLVYKALTQGMVYVDRGMAAEQQRSAQRTLEHLTRRAAALGCMLTPKPADAT